MEIRFWFTQEVCNPCPVLEITPEIPEIAGKNTSIPAMIVYLPDNLAGRNYWLLFIQGCDFSAKTRISVFFDARKVILVNRADPV